MGIKTDATGQPGVSSGPTLLLRLRLFGNLGSRGVSREFWARLKIFSICNYKMAPEISSSNYKHILGINLGFVCHSFHF
ncbi:hypothetical protein CDL12_24092 [Handroanthus impetiginosus]|uniref:Uncharacterized protein n=1 Tax=Handroanthus impetiginosus TaxID=429701 RepID=A0A2G9GDL5_9LAMI|nr:hypothetical protein CDL12_24092 [Handroanthus impetiginosus]